MRRISPNKNNKKSRIRAFFVSFFSLERIRIRFDSTRRGIVSKIKKTQQARYNSRSTRCSQLMVSRVYDTRRLEKKRLSSILDESEAK